MAGWVAPSALYTFLLGFWGISARYGLQEFTWRGLLALTAAAYLVVLVVVALIGGPFRSSAEGHNAALDLPMAAVAAFISPVAVVLFFYAISHGPITRIVPITSVYPLIAVAFGVAFLSEALTWKIGVGVLLVVGGVVLLGL
jgi:bacterial/archaeal transporter family protein